MGKSKLPPANAARGIAAYKKTMEDGLIKTGEESPGSTDDSAINKIPESALLRKTKNSTAAETLIKTSEKPPLSKYARAAQFMVLIGSDEASKILSRLESDQVEAISKEIVTLKRITPEEAEAVLLEFRELLSPAYKYSGSSTGGIEEARRILYAAFGPEKGEAQLLKAVPDAAENPFDFLKDFTGEQLALLFQKESPAACAMVFSRLPSKLCASVLANISPKKKLEIVRRIAHLKETSPEVLNSAAAALKEKARFFGKNDEMAFAGGELDGRGVLTAILKHSDISFSGRLLEGLEEDDPLLSREMKDRLYTLEDIAKAADRPIQEKLRTMEDQEIALLIKGRSEIFTQKILDNLSQNRAERIREECEIMGAVPRIEAEAAGREFLNWFRQNREEGRILMITDEDVVE